MRVQKQSAIVEAETLSGACRVNGPAAATCLSVAADQQTGVGLDEQSDFLVGAKPFVSSPHPRNAGSTDL